MCGVSVVGVALLLALSAPLFADRLVLTNGRELPGIVEAETSASVTIHTPAGMLTIPRARIRQLVKESEAENEFHRLAIALAARDAAELLGRLEELRKLKFDTARPAALLREHEAELSAALERAAAPARQGLLDWLEQAAERLSEDVEFQLLVARQCGQAGAYGRARAHYLKIPLETFTSDAALTSRTVAKLIGQAQHESAAGKFKQVDETLRFVARLQPGADIAPRGLLLLRWGAHLRDNGGAPEALELYRAALAPLFPAISRNRTLFTLERARRALRESGAYARALELQEKYGRPLAPADADAVRADLLLEAGRQQRALKKFAAAQARLDELAALRPELAKRELRLLRFEQDRAKLPRGDAPAHYALAQRGMKERLFPQTRELLEPLAKDAVLGKEAEARLRELDELEADALFLQAQQHYGAGRFYQALDAIDEIVERFPLCQAIDKARQLERMTLKEIRDKHEAPRRISENEARNPDVKEPRKDALDQERISREDVVRIQADPEGYLEGLRKRKRNVPEWLRAYQAGELQRRAEEACRQGDFRQAKILTDRAIGHYGDTAEAQGARALRDWLYALMLCRELETGQPSGLYREAEFPADKTLRAELERIFAEAF